VGHKLRTIINTDTDSVRCYRLDAVAVSGIQILGIGRVTVEEPYILVGRKT
jgi:CRISPR-associated protein Cas2